MGVSESLDRFFEISGRGSTISTEVKGGILIFLSMVYIIAVNTGMMVAAGMDESACYTATIVMAIIGTLLMALYAKFPVAQAPLMGVNAFFAYTIAGTMGFTWQEALVAVLISGVIFFVIAITGVRKRVLDQIPASLRFGITAGIGCFIVFIGLQNAGLIADSTTLVGLGDFSDPAVILAFFCIILTLFLYAMRIPGAVFFGMIVAITVGIILVPFFFVFVNNLRHKINVKEQLERTIDKFPLDKLPLDKLKEKKDQLGRFLNKRTTPILLVPIFLLSFSSCKLGQKYTRPDLNLPESIDPDATATADSLSAITVNCDIKHIANLHGAFFDVSVMPPNGSFHLLRINDTNHGRVIFHGTGITHLTTAFAIKRCFIQNNHAIVTGESFIDLITVFIER